MSSIRIRDEGWPYEITFSGRIEVQRLDSGNIAIRKVSDDSTVSVRLDEEELERHREVLRAVRQREREFNLWFAQQMQQMDKSYWETQKGRP